MSYPPPPPEQPGQPYDPGQPPMYPPVAAPTSGKATTSLILGIVSLVACGLVAGIPAIILGRQAKREIQESGGRMGGEGVATAGFVTGLIGTILSVLGIIVVIILLVIGAAFFNDCSTTTDSNGNTTVNCN